MGMGKRILAEEARVALMNAQVTADRIVLSGQLDRKTYVIVNKALEAAGAKWDRRAGAHVSGGADLRAMVDEILESGIVPAINPLAYYSTPDDVARQMAEFADVHVIRPVRRILEPSAGTGALISAAVSHLWVTSKLDAVETIDAVEIDPARCATLKALGEHMKIPLKITCADFLELTPEAMGGVYDVILMNPPFAVDGMRDAGAAHVLHARQFVAPGGVLVAVLPASVRFRMAGKYAQLRNGDAPLHLGRDAVVLNSDYTIYPLPSGTFSAAGTGVETALYVWTPPKGKKGNDGH